MCRTKCWFAQKQTRLKLQKASTATSKWILSLAVMSFARVAQWRQLSLKRKRKTSLCAWQAKALLKEEFSATTSPISHYLTIQLVKQLPPKLQSVTWILTKTSSSQIKRSNVIIQSWVFQRFWSRINFDASTKKKNRWMLAKLLREPTLSISWLIDQISTRKEHIGARSYKLKSLTLCLSSKCAAWCTSMMSQVLFWVPNAITTLAVDRYTLPKSESFWKTSQTT